MLNETIHELVPKLWLKVNHAFGVLVCAGRSTFNEVTRDGKWRSGKREQRYRRW